MRKKILIQTAGGGALPRLARVMTLALLMLTGLGTGARAATIDLSTVSAATTAQDGDVLTGTLAGNYKISIADGATVTLQDAVINGVNVNDDAHKHAGLTLAGDGTIVLKGTNTVKGFYEDWPGIYVPSGKTVTIQGDGSLTASSNGYACGIGGGYTIACGNIEIQSGTITATGGSNSAGIGGGNSALCGNISITGGSINATGGAYAAGIGGARDASCGNISITGGTITATGGSGASGIGSGYSASCGTITITDGVVSVTATKGSDSPNSIGAGKDGSCGTVTIGGTEYPGGISESPYTYTGTGGSASTTGFTVTLASGTEDADNWTITPSEGLSEGDQVTIQYSGTRRIKSITAVVNAAEPAGNTVDLAALTANYEAQDGDVLTGTLAGNYKISIADGATVTLQDAVINGTNDESYSWAGITLAGDGTIVLKGTNTVKGFYEDYPGIYVPSDKTVTIQGDGSLTASSNGGACGIGGGYEIACGNITIEGGTITATGVSYAAGIGGGDNASCGDISITGGTINAQGGSSAPGIGSGGSGGSCGNITITDGVVSVTATKGNYSPNSIGKGDYGSCGTVTIGGTEYPGGISESPYTYDPNAAPAGNTVDLAALTANYEAQDGDVLTGTLAGNYKISIADGATVTLQDAVINGVNNGGYSWAGLTLAGDGTIVLKGTNTVKGFYNYYPGIYVPSGKTVTIKGDGSLTASSNGYACGIGGGYHIACGNITIEGGTITATGGNNAAGIGGGQSSSCGNILITGGTINATGSNNAAGIGSGRIGSCGNITIANTVTMVTATKGSNAPNSIGNGNGGSCGTVTIGGTEYLGGISESPYTYQP